MPADPVAVIASVLFAVAVLHTFSTRLFHHLAHRQPRHAALWRLLGEVEAVFGFWAGVLVLVIFALHGSTAAVAFMDAQRYTEPLFVFVVMVVAGSRPVRSGAVRLLRGVTRMLPVPGQLSGYFCALAVLPLLGSLITEPGAMTLAALVLGEGFFAAGLSPRLQYATLGVLFVNVSLGGALSAFAAPPIVMVAERFGWGSLAVLTQFGWRAALAVAVNAAAVTFLFRRELSRLPQADPASGVPCPLVVTLVHGVFLAAIVAFAAHPPVFLGLFLFFLGYAHAYRRHQDELVLEQALMVGFFLAGVVVLGGAQRWWLQPLLAGMNSRVIYYGASLLTAVTDNAALTYLGSLVEPSSAEFRRALVAGSLTGGGLTVIANAPNPAGFALLRRYFAEESIGAARLAVAALIPTLVAVIAFRWL